jgi:hypothetical protein
VQSRFGEPKKEISLSCQRAVGKRRPAPVDDIVEQPAWPGTFSCVAKVAQVTISRSLFASSLLPRAREQAAFISGHARTIGVMFEPPRRAVTLPNGWQPPL